MKYYIAALCLCLCSLCHNVWAEDEPAECCCLPAYSNQVLLAGDVFHIDRQRKQGAKQHGWLTGGHFFYRHIKRYHLYWALEGAYAVGPLHGKSAKGKLHSSMTDAFAEVQLGYTLQDKERYWPSLTPYIGVGRLWDDNKFNKSSPLPLHYKIRYSYASAGMLTNYSVTEQWNIGINFKVRYMWRPKCSVSNDPDFEKVSLKIGNDHWQYRIELPVNYRLCSCPRLAFTFIPFYERRCYGGCASYPFDFIRTRYIEAGATIGITYMF